MNTKRYRKTSCTVPMAMLILSCCITVLGFCYIVYKYPFVHIFPQTYKRVLFIAIFTALIILYIASIVVMLTSANRRGAITMQVAIILLTIIYIEFFSYNRFKLDVLIDGVFTWYLMGIPVVITVLSITQYYRRSKSIAGKR